MEKHFSPIGKFVLIEGPDTAGKSTQAQLLKEELERQGKKVVTMHFPNYDSPFGKMIKNYLKGQVSMQTFEEFLAMQMVYIADQLAAQEEIQLLLKQGVWIIADRYDLSTLAYSYARLKLDGAILTHTLEVLKRSGKSILSYISNMQSALVKPDITFVLDLPYQEVKKRKQELDGFESDDDFMKYVSEIYHLLGSQQTEYRRVQLIEATQTIEEVQQLIREHIESICESEELSCN